MDSTLMTSAPMAARYWVANGPAQKAVKSTMRRPASGRPPAGPGGAPATPRSSGHAGGSAPSRGAGASGRRGASHRRYGGRGGTKAAPRRGGEAPAAAEGAGRGGGAPGPAGAPG